MRGRTSRWVVALLSAALVGVGAYSVHREGPFDSLRLVELGAGLGLPLSEWFGDEPPPMLELAPPVDNPVLVAVPRYGAQAVEPEALRAFAYQYESRVYAAPARTPTPIGIVRRGIVLRAGEEVPGPGCTKGAWYAVDAGVVCSRDGFAITEKELQGRRQPPPDVQRGLPYRYGRVTSREALRYYRIPTREEEELIAQASADGAELPDVVVDQLDGDYFLALDRVETHQGRRFYRTIPGRYVREEVVAPRSEPALRGELLGAGRTLPIAFVYGEDQVSLLSLEAGALRQVGIARKHARFPLTRVSHVHGRELAFGPGGKAVARRHVRIASKRSPPEDVPRGAKWIHIDLDEQVLVAYQGEVPAFVTLVSTGREGYDTPTGLFRIHEKHTTTTMRGDDPVDGHFEVSEVPWTMFYDGNYALHGAYWHNDFGRVRSHGCTNLAPVDARWLFHFAEGELPQGWHARRKLESSWVYITQEAGQG